MIKESIIDNTFDWLESDDDRFDSLLAELEEKQPELMAYLSTEDLEVFTEEEYNYLVFLAVVIWQSIIRDGKEPATVNMEDLSEADERNWTLLDTAEGKKFHQRIAVFFEGYQQEDLLAFIEDALAEHDDDFFLTKEGREPMFITLKTITDCLTKNL